MLLPLHELRTRLFGLVGWRHLITNRGDDHKFGAKMFKTIFMTKGSQITAGHNMG